MEQQQLENLVAKGELAFELNDFKMARIVLQQIKNFDPNHIEALLIEATLLITESNQYAEALVILEKIIQNDPTQVRAQNKLAACLLRLKRYEEGILKCNKVNKLDPAQSSAYYYKGLMLTYLKRNDEAAEQFKILEQLPSVSEKDYIVKGTYLIYQQKDEEAFNQFLEGLQKFPGSVKLNYYCSKQLLKLKRYQEANKYLDKVLEINEDWSGGWQQKASLNKEMKQYNEAINNINQAIKLNEIDATNYILKAEILKEQKKYLEAIEVLNQRLQLAGEIYEVTFFADLAELYKISNKLEDGICVLKQGLEKLPHSQSLWNKLGSFQRVQKKFEEALQSFTRSVECDPTFKAAFYNSALTYQNLNKIEEAIKMVNKSLVLDSKYKISLKLKGELLEKQNNYVEAIECFDMYLSIDPTNTELLNSKGNCFRSLKRFSESIACYDQIISLKPTLKSAVYNKGLSLKNMLNYDEALSFFEQAIKLEPKAINSYLQKVEILKLKEKWKEAIETLDLASNQDVKNLDILTEQASIQFQLKQFQKAIEYYDKIIQIDPNRFNTLHNKGLAKKYLGQYEEAILIFDNVLKQKENYGLTLLEKGISLRFLKRFPEAEQVLLQLSKLEPQNSNCWYEIAANLKDQKKKEAIEYFKKSLECNPNNQLALEQCGFCLFDLGQWKKSVPFLQQALEKNINSKILILTLSYAFYNLKQIEDALNVLKKLIEIDNQSIEGNYWIGQCMLSMGQQTQAIVQFDKCLSINPKYENAYIQKGVAFSQMKMWNESILQFDKALEIQNQNKNVLLLKGNILFNQAKLEEALQIYLQSEKIEATAAICYNIGLTFQKLKNVEAAYDYYTKSLKIDSTYISSYCQRGVLLIKTKKEDALKDLKIAQQLLLDPSSSQTEAQVKTCQNIVNAYLNIDQDINVLQTNINSNSDKNQQLQQQIQNIVRRKTQILQNDNIDSNQSKDEISDLTEELNKLKNLVLIQQNSIEMHDSQLKSLKLENQQVQIILDQSGIKLLAQIKGDIDNLYKTNQRAYEYFKAFYWTLLNYFMAYRTLSTGLIQANYDSDTEDTLKEKMIIAGAKKALEVTKEVLKSIPFIGAGVAIVDKLLETYFELKKKLEFKKRVSLITSIIQKDNGKDILFDDINLIVAKGVLEICKKKLNQINKYNKSKQRIDKKVIEKTINTIDQIEGNLGSVKTQLYNEEIGMLALEDVVFLLGYFYEHGEQVIQSKKKLDEIMVEIVIIELKKKSKEKECSMF